MTTNVVDVVTPNGEYVRALDFDGRRCVVRVRQIETTLLDVTATGAQPARAVAIVQTMLGTQRDLRRWQSRAARFPWIARLARALRGMKPPRYPTLWEALCNAVVFQQLSIVAASSIMRRFVEAFSEPMLCYGCAVYPFPQPERLAAASPRTLLGVGLSRQKSASLGAIARAFASNAVDAEAIGGLPTPAALEALRALPGIGPWSAANVLLRGLGRLDAFPLQDSGVRANVIRLAGDANVDLARVLEALGDVRGMLYFHLLLGGLGVATGA